VRAKQLAIDLGGAALHHQRRGESPARRPLHAAALGADALLCSPPSLSACQPPARSSVAPSTEPREAVGERLAATGTGVAVHPSAVRERAARCRARAEAAGAEERLRTGEAEPSGP
jgi:hypothetical protein